MPHVIADVIDYAQWRPAVSDLRAAGITAVCRYLGTDDAIDAAEYNELLAAGIGVVLAWRPNACDGYGVGVAAGAEARKRARALGHPDLRPIYVDFVGVEYQRGFNAGGCCGSQGLHGDARAADALFAADLISAYWQTSDTVDDPRAALVQRTTHSHFNLPFDRYDESDRVRLDYGQVPAPSGGRVSAPREYARAPRLLRRTRFNDVNDRAALVNQLLDRLGYDLVGDAFGSRTAHALRHFKITHGFRDVTGTVCDRKCFRALKRG